MARAVKKAEVKYPWTGDHMTSERTPVRAEKRSYPELPDHLRAQWEAIPPGIDDSRPCSVALKDGTTLPCVYVMAAQQYIDAWLVWPEDDPGKRHIRIEDVVSIFESPSRLAPRFAEQLYRAGESGMGHHVFTLVFSDRTEQVCVSGNALDFVQLPAGKSTADIVAVLPHKGKASGYVQSPGYHWCLFGAGEPPVGARGGDS